MPVQMIELEEVTMMVVNDEALEAVVTGDGGILGFCGSECLVGGNATCHP